MKNKYWIMLLGAIAAWCLVLAIVPAANQKTGMARVKSGNTAITVDLQKDQEFTLDAAGGGYNTVTVSGDGFVDGEGYTVVPVSELLLREDYYIDHTGRQCPA